jgi:hypothetical protein
MVDSMSTEYKLQIGLIEYVNAATDLAESVKRNIQHAKNGVAAIDDETVVKLNKFRMAANQIADLPTILSNNTRKFN